MTSRRLGWVLAAAIWLAAAQVNATEAPALKTQKDKVSYAIGMDIAGNFKHQGIDVDVDLFVKGLRDGFSGAAPLMSQSELTATLNEYKTQLMEKHAAAMKTAGEDNQKAGEAFLARNKTKKGVVTLPSGLQYRVIKMGKGKKPVAADTVECNYRGALINGTEFDSSYTRGEPATFKVSQVIPGWQEALKLMPVGSKWELFIPSRLAYGAQGAGPVIGPNSTLVFEVELLGIK